MKRAHFKPSLFFMVLLAAISCGGAGDDGGNGTEGASVRILIQFPEEEFGEALSEEMSTRQSVEDIRIITITIEDGFPTIEKTFDVTDLPIQERIFVPVGENRIFTVRARDINELLIAIGSAIIDVFPGDSNTATIQLELVEEICDDAIDNNEDGDADCSDPACEGEGCNPADDSLVCENGQCVEPTPPPTPTPTPTPQPNETLCFDNSDNDEDGLADCADPDCEGRICRIGAVSGVCGDGSCRTIDLVAALDDICGVDFTVTNQGDLTAPLSTTRVTFVTSTGDVSVNLATPSLGPGQSVSFTVNIGDALPTGSFCFIPNCIYTITVDANNQLPESSEGNNTILGLCPG